MKWIRVYFDDGQTAFLQGDESTLRTLEAGKRASVRALKVTNPVGDAVWIDCDKVSSFALQDAASVRRMARWLEPIADLGDELWPDEDEQWGPGAN
jgi:hypothetical protein